MYMKNHSANQKEVISWGRTKKNTSHSCCSKTTVSLRGNSSYWDKHRLSKKNFPRRILSKRHERTIRNNASSQIFSESAEQYQNVADFPKYFTKHKTYFCRAWNRKQVSDYILQHGETKEAYSWWIYLHGAKESKWPLQYGGCTILINHPKKDSRLLYIQL